MKRSCRRDLLKSVAAAAVTVTPAEVLAAEAAAQVSTALSLEKKGVRPRRTTKRSLDGRLGCVNLVALAGIGAHFPRYDRRAHGGITGGSLVEILPDPMRSSGTGSDPSPFV